MNLSGEKKSKMPKKIYERKLFFPYLSPKSWMRRKSYQELVARFDTTVCNPGISRCHFLTWEPQNYWWRKFRIIRCMNMECARTHLQLCAVPCACLCLSLNTCRGVYLCGSVTFPPWTLVTPLCRGGGGVDYTSLSHTHSPGNWWALQVPRNFRALHLDVIAVMCPWHPAPPL